MSYIDREDLQHWLKRLLNNRLTVGDIDGYALIGYIRRWVFDMPEADVDEVRHGNWISTGLDAMDNELLTCDQCGHTIWIDKTKFCPNCGADMRGGSKSERHTGKDDS